MPGIGVDAEEIYRIAWYSWLLTTNSDYKDFLSSLMIDMQPLIADGPFDDRWSIFCQSLPGFLDFVKREYLEDHPGSDG